MLKNILVVADSAANRAFFSKAVSSIPGEMISVTSSSSTIILKKLEQTHYDIVLLDIEVCVLDNFKSLQGIRKEHQSVDVVILSGVTEKDATVTMEALKIGALGFVNKPNSTIKDEVDQQFRYELQHIFRVVELRRLIGRSPIASIPPLASSKDLFQAKHSDKKPFKYPKSSAPMPVDFALLAIGVSTGGPKALIRLMSNLPPDFPLPILIVQHMPPLFTKVLSKDLNNKSQLQVTEATEGYDIKPGTALIAPGGRHMVVQSGKNGPVIGLNDQLPENSCRPSVDVLFRSIADIYGNKGILALIMTGMGSDGLKGVQTLKTKNCYCISQSKHSCVVYGMPGVIDEAGLSNESLDLDKIAPRLTEIISGRK